MSVQIESAYKELADQKHDSARLRRTIAALPSVDAANIKSSLMHLIEDGMSPARVRLLATESLARLPSAQIQLELELLVGDHDPRVAAAAVTALGRKGTMKAITVVEPLIISDDPVLSSRAIFAAALLAHRFQIAGHDLSAHIDAKFLTLPAQTRPIKIQPISANDSAAVRITLEQVAIPFESNNNAWDVVCGGRRYMILVDRAVAKIRDVASFMQAKQYVGQLAFQNPTNGTFSPGLAILLTPTETNSAALGLYRVDGTLVLGGEGRFDSGRMAFTLAATDRPGAAPVQIQGYYGPYGLVVDTAVSAGRAGPARRPTPERV
jgi:hypothetical protein